ncbi:MFS transporter [Oceanithermus sp.]|uniref:MFS transporter n=1 Tax=Oceanithermus sp. TaxID=2268145 RepID=UPI002579A801|nr:MFS transporter [Oceanithermus sp.]
MRPHTTPWYLSLSAYWFATSFKWFLVLLVLLPARVAELVDPAEKATRLGWLFAVGAVMAFVGPPVFGFLSDRFPSRWGRRMPYLVAGSLLTAVALVWMAYAPSYWSLFAAYIVLQLADDLATGPYSALIPDLVPHQHRGTASGWMGALQVSAQIAAGVVGFTIAHLPLLFWITAGLNLVAAAWTLLVIREARGVPGRREGFVESMLAPWKNPDFRWVWGTRFLVMFGQYVVQTYLQYYLADVVRVFTLWGRSVAAQAFQAVALLGLVISAGAAVSSVPAGRWSDRVGRKRPIYLAGGVMAFVILPLLMVPRYDVLVFVALLFGLGYGAYTAVDWALATDVLGAPEAHATDMGIWQTSIVLPQILAGSLGGMVDLLNRSQPGSGYTALFLLAAAGFVLGTVLVRQVRSVR